jgi:hypothetical protein
MGIWSREENAEETENQKRDETLTWENIHTISEHVFS